MANEMLDFVFSNMLLAADAGILNETSNASVNGISLISMLNTVSPTLLEYLFFFLAFLIFLTAFIVFVPLYIDQNWANKTNVTLMAKIDSIKDSHFSEDTKKELIEKIIDAAQEPRGVVGTTRRTLAVSILLVIGITVFIIVLISDQTDLINTTLASLTSVFATVIGFYFGGSQAKDILNQTAQSANVPPAPSAPSEISGLSPDSGGGNTTVGFKIFGTNFPSGSRVTLQMTGQQSVEAKNVNVTPKVISCDFDLPAAKGIWDVVIVSTDGTTTTLKNGFTIT